MRPIPDLASADWLIAHQADPELRVADCRWSLGDPGAGRRAYEQGHLPGAIFIDVDRDLAAPREKGPGRHPIPEPRAFEHAMARAGIGETARVVAYDDTGGATAARLWFLLRYFGHETGAVLDGGIAAWQKAGGTLDRRTPAISPPATPFRAQPRPELVLDRVGVTALLKNPGALLLDARAPERYRGETEPVDPRAGHIPGAKSAPFGQNLASGHFRPPAELRRHFESLGAAQAQALACYCGSGVTACHDLLALTLAGFDGARLYEGSWSDWCADPAAPIKTGSEP